MLLHGNPFCDLTFRFADRETLPPLGQEVFADSFAINPGGSFNVSAALSRLGFKVGLKARLGTDIFSRYILERMEAHCLSQDLIVRVAEPTPVVTVGISFPHDRLFISYGTPDADPSAPGAIAVADLELYHPRVLFTHGDDGIAVFQEARRRGVLVVLDTHWDVNYLRSEYLRGVLREVDVAVPNLPEALEITGAADATTALDRLSEWCSCVVIKMGAEGCIANCDGQRYRAPALDVGAVETTGAGDNFNAGLIYGLLRGYSFETALRCANITGGLSTLVPGGCEANAGQEVVERMLTDTREHEEVENA